MQVCDIPTDQIYKNRFQFRHGHDEDSIRALAEDIGRQGQIEPAIVIEHGNKGQTTYLLIVGHRRAAACETLGIPLRCIVERERPTYDLMQMVWAENLLREPWTPSERANLETNLHRTAYLSGKISTKTRRVAGVPSYAVLRAQQTGESERTIENYLALGAASSELKHAVDIAAAKDKATRRSAAITLSGGFSLARFDADTQRAVLDTLHEQRITHAGPREVAAVVNAVRQRAGQEAVKDGEAYEPGEETRTLGADLALTKKLNGVLMSALEFYADPGVYSGMTPGSGGTLARHTLEKVRLAMQTCQEPDLSKPGLHTGEYEG